MNDKERKIKELQQQLRSTPVKADKAILARKIQTLLNQNSKEKAESIQVNKERRAERYKAAKAEEAEIAKAIFNFIVNEG